MIGEAAETDDGQHWLRAVIATDSQWFSKILGDTMSANGSIAPRFSEEIHLPPAEMTSVRAGAAE